ncbi:MAG: dienelactone hydrolase family protein [Bacteroidetes bacterium]|nr:dienelactone hydrolase family protein [Bacteroidota bacterium]
MKKINKKDLDPKIFELYDGYAHNKFSRREFVEKLSFYAIGGLTVPVLLDYLMPRYKSKQQTSPDDPNLETAYIEYDSPKGAGKMKALLAKPAAAKGKLPGIIVVHENRGLNPHIEDVCRRAALENFIAIAPDALTPLGGYPGTDDEGRTLQRQRDRDKMLADFIAAYDYLSDHPDCTGKIGVVGFCFGGWISNMMAVRVPGLDAAVPFYGGQPDASEVPKINAPLLLHFGGLDERVNAGWPDYEAALKANRKKYTAHFYEDKSHGFHNDTTPRYDVLAAKLAWKRTIEFFQKHLR